MTTKTVSKQEEHNANRGPSSPSNIRDIAVEPLIQVARFLPSPSRLYDFLLLLYLLNLNGPFMRYGDCGKNHPIQLCGDFIATVFKPLPTAEERADMIAVQCNLLMKSLPIADNVALQQDMNRSTDGDFSYTLACHMADNCLLDLKNWLLEVTNRIGKAAVWHHM